VILPTDRSASVAEIAVALEERGLESLFLGEHTHIPAARTSPFPMGDGTLPDEYTRTVDPFVALAFAAARTTTVRLGTCILLLAQRDAIVVAKEAATLDLLSGGRIEIGVGYGWNVEEAADHGVAWKSRRARVREQALAMQALWTQDEASFAGDHVVFDRAWMWPKPVQAGGPPILLGASPGPKTFAAVAEWARGWIPVPFWGHTTADIEAMRRAVADAGRDPAEIEVTVDGVFPDAEQLDVWHAAGAHRVLLPLPSEPIDQILPILDAAAALVSRYA